MLLVHALCDEIICYGVSGVKCSAALVMNAKHCDVRTIGMGVS